MVLNCFKKSINRCVKSPDCSLLVETESPLFSSAQQFSSVSIMANVRDSDTSLWLHNKLGTSNDSWTGGSICSQLSAEVLRNIKECFPDLQTQVKLKLLLSFFHIPRRNVEEVCVCLLIQINSWAPNNYSCVCSGGPSWRKSSRWLRWTASSGSRCWPSS
jgi:hypothetical protein